MASTAPFIGSPLRRVAAGAIDLVICLIITFFGWGISFGIGSPAQVLEGAFLNNKAAYAVYGVYHAAFFWLLRGQTLALLLLNLRLARASDGTEPNFLLAVFRAGARPLVVFGLVLAADFANSSFRPLVLIAAVPLIVEMGMMFTLPSRQTLSDLLCRTLVINLPVAQPHRAPAGPMYSRSDSEFGVRPHRQ